MEQGIVGYRVSPSQSLATKVVKDWEIRMKKDSLFPGRFKNNNLKGADTISDPKEASSFRDPKGADTNVPFNAVFNRFYHEFHSRNYSACAEALKDLLSFPYV
jgi:hypothetical protein